MEARLIKGTFVFPGKCEVTRLKCQQSAVRRLVTELSVLVWIKNIS